jgi:hypothetical protein
VLVVALHADRFPALLAAARAALPEDTAAALSAVSLADLLGELLGAPQMPDPSTLPGFDRARPMLVRAGESAFTLHDLTSHAPVALRFVIALPATQSAHLAASVESHLASCAPLQPRGFDCGQVQLNVEPTADWVFIVGVPEGAARLDAPLLATSPAPLEAWALEAPDGGFVLRGARLRPWFTALGRHQLERALAYVHEEGTGEDDARGIRAHGALEVAAAYAQLSRPAEVATVAGRVDFEPLRSAIVLQMSTAGAAEWHPPLEARAGAGAASAQAQPDIALRASSDLMGLLGDARPDAQGTPQERQALRACGVGCVVHALLTPLASLQCLRAGRRPSFQVTEDATLAPSTLALRVTPPDARMLRADALLAHVRLGATTLRLGVGLSEDDAAAALTSAQAFPQLPAAPGGTPRDASDRCLAELADTVSDLGALAALVPEDRAAAVQHLRERAAAASSCVTAPGSLEDRDGYMALFDYVVPLLLE